MGGPFGSMHSELLCKFKKHRELCRLNRPQDRMYFVERLRMHIEALGQLSDGLLAFDGCQSHLCFEGR